MPEKSGAPESFDGRAPTSHEARAGMSWDESYRGGPAPWDIGRPQPVVVRLANEGKFVGRVLDVGCGTGENALHIASNHIEVLGVDVAGTAIDIAKEKAATRGSTARFRVGDALRLEQLGAGFDTVLDCGLFHSFDARERALYAASLASVATSGSPLYVLCFSDEGPGVGPHPMSQDDLRAAFARTTGWSIASIERERTLTRFHDGGAPAWLATIRRI